MQLPVEQFPILTPGQMNPFHQALQTGLENYQQNMKTAYMPYALQADIASKQAYSQNLQRQIAAQALTSPAAASMTTDQITNLLNMVQGGGNQRQIVGLPGQSNGPGGGFFDWLKSFGSGGQSTSAPAPAPQAAPQAPVDNSQAPQTTSSGTGANSGYEFNSDGTNKVATPQEVDDTANRPIVGDTTDNYADQAASVTPPPTQPMTPAQVADNLRRRAQLQQTGNVMTGKGKGVGAGTTYGDPDTGNTYSSLTPSNVGPTQASILATQRVAPYIKNLSDNYRNSFGLVHNIQAGLEAAGSFITGGRINTPHLSSYQQTTSDRKAASEGLIRDFALNATGGNREALEDMLDNIPGESPDNYQQRLQWLYHTFESRDKAGRNALLKGIRLNPAAVATPAGRNQLDATTQSVKSSPATTKPEITKNIGGTTFHKINGKWYPYLGDQ